jgi:hypothetical protein
MTDEFLPPHAPFASSNSLHSLSPRASNTHLLTPSDGRSSPSRSVNYLPAKFSGQLFSRRRNGKNISVPKRGGGRDAFKANESRMPGNGDEDYDGIQGNLFGGDRGKRKLRWTKFKWILFVANTLASFSSFSPLYQTIIKTIYFFPSVNHILPYRPHLLSPHLVPCMD